jgi:hypothetical protein
MSFSAELPLIPSLPAFFEYSLPEPPLRGTL